jgi:hypothetical protein
MSTCPKCGSELIQRVHGTNWGIDGILHDNQRCLTLQLDAKCDAYIKTAACAQEMREQLERATRRVTKLEEAIREALKNLHTSDDFPKTCKASAMYLLDAALVVEKSVER